MRDRTSKPACYRQPLQRAQSYDSEASAGKGVRAGYLTGPYPSPFILRITPPGRRDSSDSFVSLRPTPVGATAAALVVANPQTRRVRRGDWRKPAERALGR